MGSEAAIITMMAAGVAMANSVSSVLGYDDDDEDDFEFLDDEDLEDIEDE